MANDHCRLIIDPTFLPARKIIEILFLLDIDGGLLSGEEKHGDNGGRTIVELRVIIVFPAEPTIGTRLVSFFASRSVSFLFSFSTSPFVRLNNAGFFRSEFPCWCAKRYHTVAPRSGENNIQPVADV